MLKSGIEPSREDEDKITSGVDCAGERLLNQDAMAYLSTLGRLFAVVLRWRDNNRASLMPERIKPPMDEETRAFESRFRRT